jgi:hypothetical protein
VILCSNPTCINVSSVFVLSCGVEAFRWADPPSKEPYQLSIRLIFSEINCEWEAARRRTDKSHLKSLDIVRSVSDICIVIGRASHCKIMEPLSRWNNVSLTSDVSSSSMRIRFFVPLFWKSSLSGTFVQSSEMKSSRVSVFSASETDWYFSPLMMEQKGASETLDTNSTLTESSSLGVVAVKAWNHTYSQFSLFLYYSFYNLYRFHKNSNVIL